jgi:hypothetical protein
MTDNPLLERRIRNFASSVDDSDWEEVVRRAGVNQPLRSTPESARRASTPPRRRRRRALLALSLAAVIAVPAAAFADDIGGLLGFSNQGTEVATKTLSRDSSLIRDMRELGFPSTLKLLGTREGVRFYAAQKPLGYCLAVVESATAAGSQRPASDIGCESGSDDFPSASNPVSVFPIGHRFAGFAADGVASVALVDASGRTLASANVSQNLFVSGAMPTGPVTIVALDAHGDVLARIESRAAEHPSLGASASTS